MAALTGSIQSNVQIYFDISDVLSFSENITDLCVHKFHIKVFENASAFNHSCNRASGQTNKK